MSIAKTLLEPNNGIATYRPAQYIWFVDADRNGQPSASEILGCQGCSQPGDDDNDTIEIQPN